MHDKNAVWILQAKALTAQKEMRLHKLLYETYKELKNTDLALENLEKYYEIKSQLLSDEASNNIKKIQTKHEKEKSEKEAEMGASRWPPARCHRLSDVRLSASGSPGLAPSQPAPGDPGPEQSANGRKTRSATFARSGANNTSSPISEMPPPITIRRGHSNAMTWQMASAR